MKVSIGIPVYNAEAFLEDAIKSIINQTFTDWELIIVDDGSTDNSLAIAKKFECDKIRVYSDGLNKKLPARLNEIVKLSRYEIIARMDADDLILPNKIEKQYNFLIDNPHIDLVSTGVVNIDSNNVVLGTRTTEPNYCPTLLDVVSGRSGIVHASIMAKKSWFKRNPYNEKNIQAEDFQLWIDAKLKNDLCVAFIIDPLYCYRVDQNVNLKKMIKGYSQQRLCILSMLKSDSLPLFHSLKEVFKLYLKQFYIILIYFIGKESLLLNKRSQDISSIEYFQYLVDGIVK